MNSLRWIIKALVAIAAILFIVLVVRIYFLPPPDTVELGAIPEGEYDPAVWGKHYPEQYRSFLKNKEMAASPTGFGGSIVFQKSDKEPELLINFKGMAFSKDYTEDRGHPYSLDDLMESKRVTAATPGSCMTCKSANLREIYKEMGWDYAKTPLAELASKLTHPVSCASCHDPATMKLKVSNPAFIEAMELKGVDVASAPRTAMRNYVCAQCHSEYFFEPKTQRVIFPWDKGLKPGEMYAYYSEKPAGFEMDWLHPDSNAKMLKAQHPDYELYISSAHGQSGVSCADCHMPYMRANGRKYSSHWVTSPMKHPTASCRTCHTQDEDWLLSRVKTIQDHVWQLQRTAGQTIARAHDVIAKAAAQPKYNQDEMNKARELIRRSQWYWDFIAAENSMGFHNPDLAQNTLGLSIDWAHQAIATANRAAGTHY